MVENKSDVYVDENGPFVVATAVSTETEKETETNPQIPERPQEEWACPACTLLNPARKLYCIACFHRHPTLTLGNVVSTEDYDDSCFHRPSGLTPKSEGFEDDDEYSYDDDDIEEYDRQMTSPDNFTGTMNYRPASSGNILEAQAEEDPFHKKVRRRMRRKRRMIAGGAAGAVVGAAIGSPCLVVAGIVTGAVGSRIVSKQRERLKDERLAMERYITETKAPPASSKS